jgi:salicylate hydroxylase
MAGCVSALVLTRLGIKCKIYELRDVPATIGGAVNLTPNALKIFKDLKIDAPGCVVDNIEIFSYYSGSKIGNLPFTGPTGPSLRVVREKLLKALLDAVEKAGVEVVYGSKLVAVVDESDTEEVVAEFENGNSAKGDFIVGCDGMFSAVRLKYVEPERVPIYTGVCSAYTLVDASNIKSPIHFQQTAVNAGRYGSLLTSYVDVEHSEIYVAAVMQTAEQGSKRGGEHVGWTMKRPWLRSTGDMGIRHFLVSKR